MQICFSTQIRLNCTFCFLHTFYILESMLGMCNYYEVGNRLTSISMRFPPKKFYSIDDRMTPSPGNSGSRLSKNWGKTRTGTTPRPWGLWSTCWRRPATYKGRKKGFGGPNSKFILRRIFARRKSKTVGTFVLLQNILLTFKLGDIKIVYKMFFTNF